MRRSATRYLGTALLCGAALLSNVAMAEIYKWVDAQGNVHFGDKPKDASIADDAEKVEVVESYKPAAQDEQTSLEEQQRKQRLRDEMRTRDDQKQRAEEKTRRDEERKEVCSKYDEAISELETVTVKDGVRHLVYATDADGNPVSSARQRELIADLKQRRSKAGCN